MKKHIFITAVTTAAILTGCNATANSKPSVTAPNKSDESVTTLHPSYDTFDVPDSSNGEYDVDLTKLSASMVYAQVYDMVNNGDNYLGKTVKAKGPFSYFQESDGREFFAVIISDATACCSQGIEFVLDGDYSYPDDYPAIDTEITVIGKFNYYKEGFYTYCQLLDAHMEEDKTLSWE
jgi:hypothetical protein